MVGEKISDVTTMLLHVAPIMRSPFSKVATHAPILRVSSERIAFMPWYKPSVQRMIAKTTIISIAGAVKRMAKGM